MGMRPWQRHQISSNILDTGVGQATPSQATDVVVSTGTLSASIAPPPYNMMHVTNFSVMAILSGSIASGSVNVPISGTIVIEASNDAGLSDMQVSNFTQTVVSGSETGASTLTYWQKGVINWATIGQLALSSSNPSTPQVGFFQDNLCGFKWMRARYLHTSGTGSVDTFVCGKGDGI